MKLYFPHDTVRPTQDDFIKEIIKSTETKDNIIAHVPVGTGKTAAIFSTLIPYILQNKLSLIFITPRHSQHKIAIETIKAIKNKFHPNLTVSDFIGKKWMCAQPNVTKSSASEFYEYCKELRDDDSCEYYTNYKDKNNIARVKGIIEELSFPMHVEALHKTCTERKFCPYEIAADIAKKADVIIADYNHILNPSIRDRFLKRTDKELAKTIIVFDESHNINQKARDLLTSTLSSFVLERAIQECIQFKAEGLAESLSEVKNQLENLAKKVPIEEKEARILKEEFKIENSSQLYLDLRDLSEEIIEEKKRSYVNSIVEFLSSWQGPDESFIRIIQKGFLRTGKSNIVISYRCLDPALIVQPVVDASYFSIFMSGTLLPTEMYKNLWGLTNTKLLEYKSPFPKENQLNLIVKGVTTKFTQRTEAMYRKIALISSNIINEIKGNSIIFFPSYKFRDQIYKEFEPLCRKTILMEDQKAGKTDREDLLERFRAYKASGAVLLAVSQGSFGEGIDLIGDLLKAVLIVGIPLSPPDVETKALIDYYDKKFQRGWDYGYLYPAIITSIQNYGRCIRSETDKGVIAFLDERYSWSSYLKCFPKEMRMRITATPVEEIKKFLTSHNV